MIRKTAKTHRKTAKTYRKTTKTHRKTAKTHRKTAKTHRKTAKTYRKTTKVKVTECIENLLVDYNKKESKTLCPMIYNSLVVLQNIFKYYSINDVKNLCKFVFFDNPNICNLRKKYSTENIINGYNYEKYIKQITKKMTNNDNTISIHVHNIASALRYKYFIKKYYKYINDDLLFRYKNMDELVHTFFDKKQNNLTILIFINKSGIECDDNTLLLLIYVLIHFTQINNTKNKMFLIANDKYSKDSNFNVIKQHISKTPYLKMLKQNFRATDSLKNLDVDILNYITKINYL